LFRTPQDALAPRLRCFRTSIALSFYFQSELASQLRVAWLRIRLSFHSSVVNVLQLLATFAQGSFHPGPFASDPLPQAFCLRPLASGLRFGRFCLSLSQGQVCSLYLLSPSVKSAKQCFRFYLFARTAQI
jgi:hypothetical protein